MCLTIRDREIKVAKKDLRVFKVLGYQPSGYCSIIIPNCSWTEGELKAVPSFSGKVQELEISHNEDGTILCNVSGRFVNFVDEIPPNVYQVYKGLHCYHPSFFELKEGSFDKTVYIANMTIPKHSKYIVGTFGDLVSLSLRFDSLFERLLPGETLKDLHG
jgi:hypothetical protein